MWGHRVTRRYLQLRRDNQNCPPWGHRVVDLRIAPEHIDRPIPLHPVPLLLNPPVAFAGQGCQGGRLGLLWVMAASPQPLEANVACVTRRLRNRITERREAHRACASSSGLNFVRDFLAAVLRIGGRWTTSPKSGRFASTLGFAVARPLRSRAFFRFSEAWSRRFSFRFSVVIFLEACRRRSLKALLTRVAKATADSPFRCFGNPSPEDFSSRAGR